MIDMEDREKRCDLSMASVYKEKSEQLKHRHQKKF